MILWFGKKKKKEEALQVGAEMEAPELSAEELATQQAAEAETARLAELDAARKAEEQAEIERKVAEANRAWEERQQREATEAESEADRLSEEAAAREAARVLPQYAVYYAVVTEKNPQRPALENNHTAGQFIKLRHNQLHLSSLRCNNSLYNPTTTLQPALPE